MYQKGKINNQLAKFFRGKKFFFSKTHIFSEHTENFNRSILLIRAFFGFSFIMSLSSFHWMNEAYSQKIYYAPLWVFFNFPGEKLQLLFAPLMATWILFSLLSFLYAEQRFFRILHSLAIFFIVALINSDGHFAHNNHGFMWISFVFSVVNLDATSHGKKRLFKHQVIMGVWFSQIMVCTFYTMSGYWKIASIVHCATNTDLDCQLDQWILTNISAREAIFYSQFSPWRDAFFKYPWLSFLSYLGTIWIHVVSFYFAFRLDLHKIFGFLRLIFHLGTFLFFGVNFSAMAAPVALIFLFSPFSRQQKIIDSLFIFLQLPPLGWILRKVSADA